MTELLSTDVCQADVNPSLNKADNQSVLDVLFRELNNTVSAGISVSINYFKLCVHIGFATPVNYTCRVSNQ